MAEAEPSTPELTAKENRKHVKKLYKKARQFIGNSEMHSATEMYRNRSKEYFEDILTSDGIMQTYSKNSGGDPKCPINNRVDGLYFCISHTIPSVSPYGEKRIIIPTETLFKDDYKMYFADFYCFSFNEKNHYITLVFTKPDSKADYFCAENLRQLNPKDNKILCLNELPDRGFYLPMMSKPHNLWLEIIYTEEINIATLLDSGKAWMNDSTTIGEGSGKADGIRKNLYCDICNYSTE